MWFCKDKVPSAVPSKLTPRPKVRTSHLWLHYGRALEISADRNDNYPSLSLPLTWHAPALYAPNSPITQVQSAPDAVARSLYVFRAPAATGVRLELASLPATGWAIYTCCQAIKRSAVIGRSVEGSWHFELAEQGTWTHTHSFPEQFLRNMGTFIPFFAFRHYLLDDGDIFN